MAESSRTLVEMFAQSCTAHAALPALGTKNGHSWDWTTYRELSDQVDRFRGALASLGVGPNDRVAMVADNRLEWAVSAYATYGLGAAFVPMYQAQKPPDWEFILRDSSAKVVVVATADIARNIRRMAPSLPRLEHIVVLGGDELEQSWGRLLEEGQRSPFPAVKPDPETPASLIYTSGTTGKPKGVMLSHGNIMSNVNSVHEIFDFSEKERSLSFIPWAHAFGQTCELHTMLSLGASIGINDSLPHLATNLRDVKPTILVAVPRIFTGIFAAVHADIAGRPGVVRQLFDAGIRAARHQRHAHPRRFAEWLALLVADPLIFSKVRARFGGHLKYAISGGAALSREVAEFVEALGITVYEGYGLTETSPMVAANCPGHVKLGSVGKIIPGVTVRIDREAGHGGPDGEIVVFGPNVMKGYHDRPEEQEKAFTPDGGFRTGDLGHVDDDGFLFITGRIKEQYKLENGKYVAPVPLEEQLKLSPYIANAMLYGANKPHNVALVVLNVDAVGKWARNRGVPTDRLAEERLVHELVRGEIDAHAASFKEFERPHDFVLTTEDFTVENELLTPTLKVKRPRVLARYEAALESLYRKASAA